MKSITVKDDASLNDLLRESQDEEVLVLRDGRAVAVLIPLDDEERAWYERERDPAFIASIARAREQVKRGQVVGHDNLRAEPGAA
jgi:PHD/YefM family antitoxin component YafN of YafNO toxin-antitoxin module